MSQLFHCSQLRVQLCRHSLRPVDVSESLFSRIGNVHCKRTLRVKPISRSSGMSRGKPQPKARTAQRPAQNQKAKPVKKEQQQQQQQASEGELLEKIREAKRQNLVPRDNRVVVDAPDKKTHDDAKDVQFTVEEYEKWVAFLHKDISKLCAKLHEEETAHLASEKLSDDLVARFAGKLQGNAKTTAQTQISALGVDELRTQLRVLQRITRLKILENIQRLLASKNWRGTGADDPGMASLAVMLKKAIVDKGLPGKPTKAKRKALMSSLDDAQVLELRKIWMYLLTNATARRMMAQEKKRLNKPRMEKTDETACESSSAKLSAQLSTPPDIELEALNNVRLHPHGQIDHSMYRQLLADEQRMQLRLQLAVRAADHDLAALLTAKLTTHRAKLEQVCVSKGARGGLVPSFDPTGRVVLVDTANIPLIIASALSEPYLFEHTKHVSRFLARLPLFARLHNCQVIAMVEGQARDVAAPDEGGLYVVRARPTGPGDDALVEAALEAVRAGIEPDDLLLVTNDRPLIGRMPRGTRWQASEWLAFEMTKLGQWPELTPTGPVLGGAGRTDTLPVNEVEKKENEDMQSVIDHEKDDDKSASTQITPSWSLLTSLSSQAFDAATQPLVKLISNTQPRRRRLPKISKQQQSQRSG